MQKANKPLPLQGTRNTRELGGYLTSDGTTTREHVFLRSDRLSALTDSDRAFLHQYGLSLDVDLRTLAERLADPDHIDKEYVRYVDVSILSDGLRTAAVDLFEPGTQTFPRTMPELYIFFLENSKPEFARALLDLIDAKDCALFHCTNGKDRTGLTAMLLLGAVNVPEDTIVADYEVSQDYVLPELKAEHEADEEDFGNMLPEGAFDSKPEFMQAAIEHIHSKYGSILDYIYSLGLSDQDIERLKAKFLS